MMRAVAIEELYVPNKWMPFGAALSFHVMLLIWNPTLMPGNPLHPAIAPMEVRFEDKMPVMEVKKPEPVKPKPVEKKIVKKAHKSGLSVTHHQKPLVVTHAAPVHKAAPPARRFVSKITIPKFVPHGVDDEPIAASPAPGISLPSPNRMVRAAAPAPKLRSKTRGVRASDINFELTDRGTAMNSGGPVVAIPIGQESGDTVALPHADVLHDAPKGMKTVAGYHFTPGDGVGSGELAGKERKGIGYHGVIQTDTYVEGSLSSAATTGHKSGAIGHGFEIGGPVGDRKIVKRQLPEYPDWAEEKGITAMVKIYFTVQPDGTIRKAMRIVQSSGYTDLDSLAKQALLKWRFTPTDDSSTEKEAWGIITFRFTLA